MFRTVTLSNVRSFSLYTQQWYMSYSLRPGSGRNCSSVLILLASCQQTCMTLPLLCVQWNTPDEGQRNCPKHVEFYSKNKFEKLVQLVSFIIRRKTTLTQLSTKHVCIRCVFRDKCVPVTTAWCVLRLRMEEQPPIWRGAANMVNKQ